jgi:uncharacterized protein YjbI with pentapeptide repeats
MANRKHLKILNQGVKVWNQWRKENPETEPNISYANPGWLQLVDVNPGEPNAHIELVVEDFCGADFSGTNLNGAKLIGANLKDADFHEAKLIGTTLNEADLSGTNFRAADLNGANLVGANLTGADFRKANFVQTNLIRAHLSKANLSEVRLFNTIFGSTYLKDSIGLDKCIHVGPSIVDHRTLQISGSLPKEFLRGCGLPDSLIESLLALVKETKYYSAFISYSHDDIDFALKLEGRLKAEGVLCWLDEHKMLPGDDKYEEVDRGIYGWDKFLLCCARSSLTSWWVDSEINKVFIKEQKLTKERGTKIKCLIPLNLDGYIFTDECRNAKKDEILSRIAADFTGWNKDEGKFEKELKRVLKSLLLDNKGREKPPEPKL